jgi:chromosome segregation ATPase
MQIYEQRQQFKQQKSDLKLKLKELRTDLAHKQAEIELLLRLKEQLEYSLAEKSQEIEGLQKVVEGLKTEGVDRAKAWNLQLAKLTEANADLDHTIKQRLALDERPYAELLTLNAPPFDSKVFQKQLEALQKAQPLLDSFSTLLSEFLVALHQRFTALTPSLPADYAACLKKLCDSIEGLASPSKDLVTSLVFVLQEVHKLSADQSSVRSSVSELPGVLNACTEAVSCLVSRLGKYLSAELGMVERPQDLQSTNQLLLATANALEQLWSELSRYVKENNLKLSAKTWTQLCSKLSETSEVWTQRFELDLSVKYVGFRVKSTRAANEAAASSYQGLLSKASQLNQLLQQTQTDWSYFCSPMVRRASNYLTSLRKDRAVEGVPYQVALQNLVKLRQAEQVIDDQRFEMHELETQLDEARQNTQDAREALSQVENECIVMQQNAGKTDILVEQCPLLKLPEELSEDVGIGAQRIAIRLTDSSGEPIPISRLSVETDLLAKMRESALHKLKELSARASKAEREAADFRKLSEKLDSRCNELESLRVELESKLNSTSQELRRTKDESHMLKKHYEEQIMQLVNKKL